MLHKTLSARRERLHEVASRRHAQALEELKVVKHSEHDAIWSWWTVGHSHLTLSVFRSEADGSRKNGIVCIGSNLSRRGASAVSWRGRRMTLNRQSWVSLPFPADLCDRDHMMPHSTISILMPQRKPSRGSYVVDLLSSRMTGQTDLRRQN